MNTNTNTTLIHTLADDHFDRHGRHSYVEAGSAHWVSDLSEWAYDAETMQYLADIAARRIESDRTDGRFVLERGEGDWALFIWAP